MTPAKKLCVLLEVCAVLSHIESVHNYSGAAFVDGGSLLSLGGAVSIPKQIKADFLESTLYAQINASLLHDRQESAWYVSYSTILKHVGWNISLSNFEVLNRGSIINWKNVIEEILQKKLSPIEMESLDHTLTSFLHLPVYNGSVKMFDQWSTKGDISTFQVIPAYINGNGNLVAIFGLFSILQIEQKGTTYDEEATGILVSTGVGVLDEYVYSKYRTRVQKKLAGYAKKYIYGLQV